MLQLTYFGTRTTAVFLRAHCIHWPEHCPYLAMEASTFSCLLTAQSPASKSKDNGRPLLSPGPAASPSDPMKPMFKFLKRQLSVESDASEVSKKKESTVAGADRKADEEAPGGGSPGTHLSGDEQEQAAAEDQARKDNKEAEDNDKEEAENKAKKGEEEEQAVAEDEAKKIKEEAEDKAKKDNEEAEKKAEKYKLDKNDEKRHQDEDEEGEEESPAKPSISNSSGANMKENKQPAAASSRSSSSGANTGPAATMKRPAAAGQKRPAAAVQKRPAAAREEETGQYKRMRKELDSEEHLSEDHERDHTETDPEQEGAESGKSSGRGDEEEEEEENMEAEEEEEAEVEEEEEEIGLPYINIVGGTDFDPGSHLQSPYALLVLLLGKLNCNDVQTALEFLGMRLKGNLYLAADVNSTVLLGRCITFEYYCDHQLPRHTVKLKLEKRLTFPGKHNLVITCKLLVDAQPLKQLASMALHPDAGGRFNQFLVVRILMGWRCIVLALEKSDVVYPGEDLIVLMCTRVKQWRHADTMRPFRSLYP
jgi:hypothetical protein